MKCQNCAKQYFCKEYEEYHICEKFIDWLDTKNYGEVKRINEGGKNVHNKNRKFR